MTWIVGSAVLFGYAVGLSDIRVTFCNGTERDCLQKIYPVGRFIAAGFAGSVAIGFAMIQRLAELLSTKDPRVAWVPAEVAEWWQADAQEIFNAFPDYERKLGCLIMVHMVRPCPTTRMFIAGYSLVSGGR